MPDETFLQLAAGGSFSRSTRLDPWHGATDPSAQVNCGGVQGLVSCSCVEIEMISRRSATKAPINVPCEVGREAAALRRCRSMHRTSATNLVTGPLAPNKTENLQDLGHRDEQTDFLKSHAGHDSITP